MDCCFFIFVNVDWRWLTGFDRGICSQHLQPASAFLEKAHVPSGALWKTSVPMCARKELNNRSHRPIISPPASGVSQTYFCHLTLSSAWVVSHGSAVVAMACQTVAAAVRRCWGLPGVSPSGRPLSLGWLHGCSHFGFEKDMFWVHFTQC